MVSRSAAGFVIIAMLMAGATPCAGWQPSAQARHDCCVDGMCPDSVGGMTGHGDVSQDAADRCCATSEKKDQRDRSQSVVAFFAVPPPAAAGVPPHTEALRLPRPAPYTSSGALHATPLYVLFSVFLV